MEQVLLAGKGSRYILCLCMTWTFSSPGFLFVAMPEMLPKHIRYTGKAWVSLEVVFQIDRYTTCGRMDGSCWQCHHVD